MRLIREFPKQIAALLILLLVVLAFGYAGAQVRHEACGLKVYEGEPNRISFMNQFRTRSCISLERVDTPSSRERGLSGRVSMDKTAGMLFVFDQPQTICLWMKDMKFALDMVWLDADKRIIKIMSDVKPETYPADFCATQAQYVIELKAGVAGQAGLREGQQLKI